MVNSTTNVVVKDEGVIVSLDLRESAKSFVFLALLLINPKYVSDFKQKLKVQTHVKVF